MHVQTIGAHFNGFSVFYFQTEENQKNNTVSFVSTFCSKKDAFNRSYARCVLVELLQDHLDRTGDDAVPSPINTCRVVDFPLELTKLRAKSWGFDPDKWTKSRARLEANCFAWVWKYFL
jgi:hypothetical protein